MELGAHLPLIDSDGVRLASSVLRAYVDAARDGGFVAVGANDHLVFQRPWLDGLVALSSVLERTGTLTLATTVALPVIRGPVPLAKAAAALQILSEGRLVLGVGPGSSAADYAAVGVRFEERWSRFDEAVHILRHELAGSSMPVPNRWYDPPRLEPVPTLSVPIWVGSWGSRVGLSRVARLGDGWLASSYNTTPEQVAAGRDTLRAALQTAGRDAAAFPIALASAWTYLTDSKNDARAKLDALAATLSRDPDELSDRVFIGDADHCAARLARYAEAGVDTAFIWPLGDPVAQLHRFAAEVLPRLG